MKPVYNNKNKERKVVTTTENEKSSFGKATSENIQQTKNNIQETLEKSKQLSSNLNDLSSRFEAMNSTMNNLNQMFLNTVLPQYDNLKYQLGDANSKLLENAVDLSLNKYTNNVGAYNNNNASGQDLSWAMNFLQKSEDEELRKGIEASLMDASNVNNVNHHIEDDNHNNNNEKMSSQSKLDEFEEDALTDEDALAFAAALELSKTGMNNNNNNVDTIPLSMGDEENDRLMKLALEMSMKEDEMNLENNNNEKEERYEGVIESKC